MRRIDSLRTYRKSNPVTFSLLTIMIVYFGILTFNGGSTNIRTLLEWGAFYKPLVVIYGQYFRFITSIFMHIGITHLLFNSFALYIFGSELEILIGKIKYLALFLLSGLGGNVAGYFFSPENISAGASGGIFGIFGVFLYFIQYHKNKITPQGKNMILSLVGINLVYTLVVPNISITGHFGGLIGGYLLSYLIIRK